MANTPYMNMFLPIPSVTSGPQWASDINTAIGNQIDGHNHTTGKGIPIPTSALQMNADLPLNGYNITTARSLRMTPQVAPIAGPSDTGALYVSGADLYFNDTTGNQVRITASGGIVGTPGSISGLVAPAAVSFNSISGVFSFTRQSNQYAYMAQGPTTLYGPTIGAPGILLTPSGAQVATFTLTLPQALPVSTKIMTLGSTGQIGAAYDVDNTSLQIAANNLGIKAAGVQGTMLNSNVADNSSIELVSNVLRVKALGVVDAMIANNTITDSKMVGLTLTAASIANNTITDAKMVGLTLTAASIANSTITDAKMAALTLTAASIANNTITDAKLVGLTITAASIANSTITGAKIANSTVADGNIISISAGKVGSGYPTTSLSGTITNAQLATGIDGGKLTNSTVQDAAIVAVSASKVANYPTTSLSGTITNAQLAGSISISKLTPGASGSAAVSNSSAGSGADVQVATITVTCSGHPIMVVFSGSQNPSGSTNIITTKFKKDGSQVASWQKGFVDPYQTPQTCTYIDLAPSAGAHTYSMDINATVSASNMNTNGTFYVVEL